MRLRIVLAVLLVSASAVADPPKAGRADSDAQTEGERAWSDFNTQENALESTSTQDCATACKALESLARAAQHLCDVAPEHCDEAKAKLRTASDRVHAACPQCEVRAEVAPRPVTFSGQEVKTVQVEAAPTKGGGCAGCAVAKHETGGGALAFALGALLAGVRRRRRRLDDLRRVRDLLRVEADPD
jgi:MYXO-CTERM domain-containing protein